MMKLYPDAKTYKIYIRMWDASTRVYVKRFDTKNDFLCMGRKIRVKFNRKD